MRQKDYYEILGVSTNANSKQIKEAYRSLAFEYHPDRNKGNSEAAEKMKRINEAYAVLSNQKKRSEYDTLREQFGSSATGHYRQSHSEQDIFKDSDVHQIFEELAKTFGFRGVDDIFRDFYGPGYRRFEFRQRNISGWQAGGIFLGFGSFPFKGTFKGGGRQIFNQLKGQFRSLKMPRKGKDTQDTIFLTPEFARTGGPYPYYLRKQSRKLVVKVPAGIREGQRIRLTGMGEPGKDGGAPGDLYLKVQLKKTIFQQIKEMATSLITR